MRKSYIVTDLVLIALSAYVCISSCGLKFGLGSLGKPGPGFMPFAAGLVLGLLALTDLLSHLLATNNGRDDQGPWGNVHWGKILFASFLLFAYTATLDKVGFLVGTLFFLIALFRVSGVTSWRVAVLSSIGTSALFYFGFKTGLDCQLPQGILGF